MVRECLVGNVAVGKGKLSVCCFLRELVCVPSLASIVWCVCACHVSSTSLGCESRDEMTRICEGGVVCWVTWSIILYLWRQCIFHVFMSNLCFMCYGSFSSYIISIWFIAKTVRIWRTLWGVLRPQKRNRVATWRLDRRQVTRWMVEFGDYVKGLRAWEQRGVLGIVIQLWWFHALLVWNTECYKSGIICGVRDHGTEGMVLEKVN